MKIKTLCALTLATAVLGNGAVSLAAANDPLETTGHVTVVDGTIDPGTGVVDPEDPEKELPELPNVKPNPNTEMGPLEISHAPVLQFGEVKTSTKEVKTHAAANEFGEEKRGAILQFGDLRTEDNGYVVNAKMTKQFTQGSNELTASTITFTNPLFNTTAGSTGTAPTVEKEFVLSYGESALVASAAAVDNSGKGMWAIEYGSSTNVSATDTTDSSVELSIPANVASSMSGGNYVADIEWSIVAAAK